MSKTSYDPQSYTTSVNTLKSTGQSFARSTVAQKTGNYHNVAEILDPRKLKNGMRESCLAAWIHNTVLPVVVSIDGTSSMEDVPIHIQEHLPDLIGTLTSQGYLNANILFMCHDDEHAIPPDAAFQMSQFETDALKLVGALNEMIIPGCGGGNRGEAYHLSFYAAANHTRLESFESDGTKGFFFMICDEEPFYGANDPNMYGTRPQVAKEVFGDTLEKEVAMLESVKKTAERYHVFIIRPGHTIHGKNHSISGLWRKLLKDAGVNPENVLEVDETDAIISTIAISIATTLGAEKDEIEEILKQQGAAGLVSALSATKDLVPVSIGKGKNVAKSTASKAIKTSDAQMGGRKR